MRTAENHQRKWIAATLLCIAVFALLCVLRAPKKDNVYWNSDAPYHVLLTVECYRETPLSTHKLVPLVTLGAPSDKWVEWGATLPDKEGNFYYTSFSAAQFIAPYVVLRGLRLPVTLMSLYGFNCVLYGVCALLTALVFARITGNRALAPLVAAGAALLYLCAPEIQHAQGVAYWAQSLFQLGFLLQLLCFLCRKDGRLPRVCFWLLCVVMPYVEWTGYIANVGFALAYIIHSAQNAPKGERLRAVFSKKSIIFVLLCAVCTAMAFLLFCLHYLTVVDAAAFFAALYARFFTRSALSGAAPFSMLLARYWRGFGALIVLAGGTLTVGLLLPRARHVLWKSIKEKAWILVAMLFPMLENMVLRGHAIMYTYDTIKCVFLPLAIFIFTVTALWEAYPAAVRKICVGAAGAAGAACVMMILQYNVLPNDYHWKVDYMENSTVLAAYVNEQYPAETSLLANEDKAQRGWENLLFGRNIYEWRTYQSLIDRAAADSKRFVVILEAEEEPNAANIYQFTGFWVYDGRELTTQYYSWQNGAAAPCEHSLPELPA